METKEKVVIEHEEAPSGAIKLYNYKEPFMPVPQGCYGYLGVLMHDAEADLIQCHICGEWLQTLNHHINKHGLTAKSYKVEFGLSNSTALIADGLREEYIKRANKNPTNFKELQKGRIKRGRTAPDHLALESKNKKGSCPLQILDRLDWIKQKLGRVPSPSEIRKIDKFEGVTFNGSGLLKLLDKTYGSYENAIEQLNWSTVDIKRNHKWTRKSLLEITEKFYKKHMRFASSSDMKRKLFPERNTFAQYGGYKQIKVEVEDKLVEKALTQIKKK